jgi:hypothetical protein
MLADSNPLLRGSAPVSREDLPMLVRAVPYQIHGRPAFSLEASQILVAAND